MDTNTLLDRIYELQYTSCVNQRYHKAMESWYGWWERAVRIAVGLLAAISLVVTIFCTTPVNVAVGLVSLTLAIVLNVIPLGEHEKRYLELFRRWTDLRNDLDDLDMHLRSRDESSGLADVVDRLRTLTAKRHAIEADEPDADTEALLKAQEAENLSRFNDKNISDKVRIDPQTGKKTLTAV